ncbi:UDP-glucuronosyltransferase 2B17-like [Trichoplusia ni]|uniref:UDP-glucuronosyltransferase n=1 Tax=Trichoplusia ni TaxID=7111 RepID=A0A7E5W5W5_TRINI|nr:UDP-glucuronosyltransferase 2B17-like [Trichoplusia ni]
MVAYLYLLTCYLLFVNSNEAARILAMFPTPSISHQVVFRPVTQELAKRGHDVTVITTDPAFPKGKAPANLTEIDIHDLSYDIWMKSFMSSPRTDDLLTQSEILLNLIRILFDTQLKDERVASLVLGKEQKFDLLILEDCVRPALSLTHFHKVPVILFSSLGFVLDNFQTLGVPYHPLLYPGVPRQRLNNLTLWDKISETYIFMRYQYLIGESIALDDKMLKRHFGPEFPTGTELSNNVDMVFLNVNPIFEGIRPVPPNVVFVGGLHTTPRKDLPADLKSYLDSSKNGVIYISFGTNVDPTLLPAEKIQVLVKAFSQLPYDVLWKWNGDELPGRTENIRISKWLPQSDLLKHPNVKLFITQGGLQSTDEAIVSGVPLLGMPLMVDQWFNVERYVSLKIGLRVDLEDVTEEKFKNAIIEVITNDSYRRNIEKLRSIMHDAPQTPLERAVWWTEYVLRHGGAKHLRSPAANISWVEYLELELVLTLLTGLSVILSVVFIVVRKLYKLIFKSSRSSVKSKRS